MWISKVCHFQNMQARITTNCWLGVFCVFLFKTVSGVPRASQRPYGVILAKCWQIWSHKKSERQIRRPLQSVERVGRPSLKYFRTPFCLQHERIFQWNPTVCLQHERTFQWHKSTISHRAPGRRARTLEIDEISWNLCQLASRAKVSLEPRLRSSNCFFRDRTSSPQGPIGFSTPDPWNPWKPPKTIKQHENPWKSMKQQPTGIEQLFL